MNNGQPISEETTPTGSPNVPATIAMQFATRRNSAPKAAEAGKRYLVSEPTKTLAMWGPTSPTKPMVPQKQTTTAVIIEMTTMQIIVILRVFMPREREVFSPDIMTLIDLL